MKFFLPFLLFLSSTIYAYSPISERECSPVNLSLENLGQVRNQGKISWCYAFSASDMLGYTFNLKEKISAADIALNYNNSFLGRVVDTVTNYGTPHETGFNKVALKRAMRNGYCPETVFPSEKWVKVQDGKETELPMKEAMEEIQKLHRQRKGLNLQNLPFYFKFKNVGAEDFYSLLQTKKLKDFFSRLRLKACEHDRISFETAWKVKMIFRGPRIFSHLSQQLESGRPVGLDYDSKILTDKNHLGVAISNLHTSVIIGRRWSPEQKSCQYLIRNSWGTSCDRYDPSYECREGNVWLNEAQIYSSMTSLVYMLSGAK